MKHKITDKLRIDWLEEGHECIPLISRDGKGAVVFTCNFSDQDWSEWSTVREAIDSQIKKTKWRPKNT
jgi:hypothetical protein